MRQSRWGFERFVGRVQRRYLVLRVLERTGLGVLGGCAAALPLLGLMMWRGVESLPIAIAALGLGTASGLAWGVIARPTRLQAAMEADRQLGWADLLSSAVMVSSRKPDDAWVAAVLSTADARCRAALPSSVILHRLGARAWGGIGLATALVLVLSLMPTYAAPTQANEDRVASLSNPSFVPQPGESKHWDRSSARARTTPAQKDPDDPNASRMGNQELNAQPQPEGDSVAGQHRGENAQSSPDGHGTGASHSKVSDPGALNTAQAATHGRADSGHGRVAYGVGGSASHPQPGNGSSAESAGSAAQRREVAPWKSDSWPDDVRRAQSDLDKGEIPDAYRDLVRDYFQRD